MCIEKLTQNYLFWHLFFKFQDLVSRMLDFDPQKRISPYFAVRHPFLRKTTPEEQQSNSANVAYHSHSNAPMSLQAPGSDFVSRPTDQNKLLLYSISANNMAMSVYNYWWWLEDEQMSCSLHFTHFLKRRWRQGKRKIVDSILILKGRSDEWTLSICFIHKKNQLFMLYNLFWIYCLE